MLGNRTIGRQRTKSLICVDKIWVPNMADSSKIEENASLMNILRQIIECLKQIPRLLNSGGR